MSLKNVTAGREEGVRTRMFKRRPPLLSAILILSGLILAILSWTDLCSFGGCTEAHAYRFYGLALPLIGNLYFCSLALLLLLSSRWPQCAWLFSLALAGGAGAELVMIHLQNNVIRAWCLLCIGIAVTVYLLCTLRVLQALKESRRYSSMNRRQFFSRALQLIVAAAVGFLLTFSGTKKPEAAGLETSLGRQSSKVEVYVFSDWLCPVCIKIEPALEAVYSQLEKKAKVFFIDKPVHQESMNFVPYHLSFLVNEKAKYLQLRKALFELAKSNKNPSLEDVKVAVAPLGVTYKQLSFMDVSQMMAKEQALANEYKVTGTPTIVVLNSSSKKSKTLVGSKDITAENLLKAVKSLE
jgi:protein-disulfide isomerase